MARKFIDVNISCLSEEVLKLASHLKWRALALSIQDEGDLPTLKKLREEGWKLGLDVASRLNIATSSMSELKNKLSSMRRKFELVGVEPSTIEVSRYAAKDSRVDFVILPSEMKLKVVDEGILSLMSDSNVMLEIDLAPIIEKECHPKLLNFYRRVYEKARGRGVKIVFASGVKNYIDLRAPRDLASLASLITLDEDASSEGLSRIPMERLAINRSKLSSSFIMPGVWLVEEGERGS